MIALVVGIVMWLWNWLVPSITGWSNINYWQALGLTLLFRFLNGNILPPMFHIKKRGSFEKMKKCRWKNEVHLFADSYQG